jgi:hypothetical protein
VSREKSTPADGERTKAGGFDRLDRSWVTKPDLRPATPYTPPPRELVAGDEVAIHVNSYGDLTLWGPYRFRGYRELPTGRKLMLLDRVLPWGLDLAVWRWSYGDATGIPADNGTTFFRFASEVESFYRYCPECRGRGALREPSRTCASCDGLGHERIPDPFRNPPRFEQRVQHYKSGNGSQPGYMNRPTAVDPNIPHVVVGFDADATGAHVGVRFLALPKATVERIMSEPDEHRPFTLDRLGHIIRE